MTIDKDYLDKLIIVTSKAAISSSFLVGKNDKNLADKAAVDAMRKELNKIKMTGEIVIGEGSLDEAPMLYTGEILGDKNGPKFDIAVDPLEGTNFAANNLPGALSVIAVAEKNGLFNAPETYMEKISTKITEKNVIDLDYTVKQNISNLSDYLNKNPEELTACILDRPRHNEIIQELKKLKVNLKLITDGDVSGALLVTDEKYNVDIFLGVGGGPEGVLAASALDTFNCNFQGRFLFKTESDIKRAKDMGIKDLNKKYEINEIVRGESFFCATGITSGELMNGVIKEDNNYITETIFTYNKSDLKVVKKRISLT